MDEKIKDWRKQGQARARQLGSEALGLPGQGRAPLCNPPKSDLDLPKQTPADLCRMDILVVEWFYL